MFSPHKGRIGTCLFLTVPSYLLQYGKFYCQLQTDSSQPIALGAAMYAYWYSSSFMLLVNPSTYAG